MIVIDQPSRWIRAGLRALAIVAATAFGGLFFVAVALVTASVLLADPASTVFFTSIGIVGGVAWWVVRPWWSRLFVGASTAAASQWWVLSMRQAANAKAWRLAEAGQRNFPVNDGGANTFAAMLGWLPGLFLAALTVAVLRVAVRHRPPRAASRQATPD